MRGNSSQSQLFDEGNPVPYKIKCRTKAAHTPLHRQGEGDGKVCKACKVWKPWDNFSWCPSDGRFYRHASCKKCVAQKGQAWAHSHHGRSKQATNHLRKRYGMSTQEYEALLTKQGGGCAICGKKTLENSIPKSGKPRRLAVDHEHAPGKRIRGLLCCACNRGLGNFRDDPKLLRAALDYLNKST